MPTTPEEATAFVEELGAEVRRELAFRSAPPPVLKFSTVALVPDPRHPRALALLLDSARRTLRCFSVALDRLEEVPADAYPPASITLSPLPSAKGTSALHSILSRGLPPFSIEVPCLELQIRSHSGKQDQSPEILASVSLTPSP